MIKTIAKPAEKKITGWSCTVGNQSCERATREQKIERK